MDIKIKKEQIRRKMARMRNSLGHDDLMIKSYSIKEKLFSSNAFKRAKKILFFMSLEKEIQTWDMIYQSFKIGKMIHLPTKENNKKNLKITLLHDLNIDFVKGSYGVKEPKKGNYDFVDPNEIELVIVPGLAFDYKGCRLGYGKGYYDRLFTNGNPRALRFGLALDFQLVALLPQSKYDLPVHLIATEKRVLFCNPNDQLGIYK